MISLEQILSGVMEGAVAGLERGADVVAARARRLAPVRNVFEGHDYHIRLKSPEEMEAARDVRSSLGLSVEGSVHNPSPGIVYGKRPPKSWAQRRLSKAAEQHELYKYDREFSTLHRRGAYEVKEALMGRRSVASTWGRRHVGGRLRGSITVTPTALTGDRAEVWVVAAAPYAKYVEMGTRHNAAHPFLRPAAEEMRGRVRDEVAAAVARSARTGTERVRVNIAVRI